MDPTVIPICIDCSPTFAKQARYTWKTISRMLGIPFRLISADEVPSVKGGVFVYYGNNPPAIGSNMPMVHVVAAEYEQRVRRMSSGDVRSIRTTGPIPLSAAPADFLSFFPVDAEALAQVWYGDAGSQQPVISAEGHVVQIAEDVVATAFYLLSLENERRTSERDNYGRFQKKLSPLGEKIYDQPVVDRLVKLLGSILLYLAHRAGFSLDVPPRWPGNAPFALALTHDVDRLQSWTFAKIKRAVRMGVPEFSLPERLWRVLWSATRAANWSGNFHFILELEKRYHAGSTFYFVSKNRMELDPIYTLSGKRVSRGIRAIQQAGSAIGLHGSFLSYGSTGMLREEKLLLERQLGQTVAGIRQHYLRLDPDVTFAAQEKTGFRYDTSVGFHGAPGYRAGTSLPFHPFNRKTNRAFGLLEIPMILMDTVLWLENNLYLNSGESWETIMTYLETTRDTGGLLVINWHNNNIHPQDVTGFTAVYERILRWAQEKGAWIASADAVWEWWEGRDA